MNSSWKDFFLASLTHAGAVVTWVWPPCLLLILYALGLAHWLWFYRLGDIPFHDLDWIKEYDYYVVLKQAIQDRQLPYYISQDYQNTDRLLGLPETILGPQIVLLPYLSIGRFFLANTLIMYSAGFLGCWLIRRRYRLGLTPFAFLFVLFNFNGFVTSHLCVGHTMWTGYFLLPFFCLYTLAMIDEGPRNFRPALKLALVLFFMILQGSFHMVIWCWLFLFFLALFQVRWIKQVLLVFLMSGWLALFRFVPAGVAFWGDKERGFWSGYPTMTDVLHGLITLRDREFKLIGDNLWRHYLGWWEYDIYVTLLGLAWLAWFGVYGRWRRDPDLEPYRYPALDAPMLILFFLSFNYFWAFVANSGIPLLNAEGVSSRFLIIPLIMLMVLAAIRHQRTLGKIRLSPVVWLIVIAGLLQIGFDLGTHSYIWMLKEVPVGTDAILHEPAEILIKTEPDRLYKESVHLSFLASLLAGPAWLFLFWRMKGSRKTP